MKKIFFVFGLLISLFASSQGDRMRPIYRFEGLEIADWYLPPTNYVLVNQRYRWVAGMFDSTLTVPTGATASLRTGGWTGAGALFVDSVNHLLKYYSGATWRDLVRLSDSTGTGYATQYDLTQISGGSQNLQQTLDIGSTLTSSETVQIGATTFTIRGVDASHEVNYVQEPDNIRMSRTVVATGISSNINITDSVYLKAENTSGPESRFIIYPDSVVSRLMSGGDFKIKYLNSGVGTKAVRYNPTTGLLTYADTTTGGGSGARFGVTGEDNSTAENRAVNFHNTNTLSLDSVNAFTVSRSAIARILMNSSASGLFSPNGNNSIQTSNVVAKLSINNDANEFTLGLDSAYSTKRISYTGNIHSTFTAYSLVTKKYVDSLIAAGVGYTTLSQFVDETAWRVYYSNGSGDITPLALGASGTVLTSNGASSAPTFTTPAAGSSNVESSVTHTSGQTLVLTSATNTVYVDPSLAIDTLTITLPDLGSIPTHLDSLYIDIYFGGTTASTNEVVGQIYIATTGGNLLFQESTPSIIYSGEHLRYKYKRSLEYWYRANNYSTRGENETIAKATIFKAFDYLTYDDTISWDYVDGRNKTIILDSHAVLLDIAGAPNGAEGTLKVVQDGTGGKRLTLPGDTAAGWWFYGQPGSSQMYHWVKDEEGFKWFMPQFFPYRDTMEVEAAMFIKRIEVEGVVWHDTLKNYFNRFIKTMKDSGWYQDASEIWFMARGNRGAYRLGIKGYRNIDFIGDLWSMYDNGADCNCVIGTYANTNLVASDTLSLNDFSISYYMQIDIGEGGQAGEVVVGATEGTLQSMNLMVNIADEAIGDPGSTQQRIQVANVDAKGFYSLVRTSTTRADLYKNGTSIGNSTITQNGSLPTIPFYLHAQNSGSTQVAGSLSRVSFLYFGRSRTAAEEANFRTAVQTLHTGFGIAQ